MKPYRYSRTLGSTWGLKGRVSYHLDRDPPTERCWQKQSLWTTVTLRLLHLGGIASANRRHLAPDFQKGADPDGVSRASLSPLLVHQREEPKTEARPSLRRLRTRKIHTAAAEARAARVAKSGRGQGSHSPGAPRPRFPAELRLGRQAPSHYSPGFWTLRDHSGGQKWPKGPQRLL